MRNPITVSLLTQDSVSFRRSCVMLLRNEYEGGKSRRSLKQLCCGGSKVVDDRIF